MLLIDKPYVSDFLIQTLQEEQFPVLQSELLPTNGATRKINQKNSSELVASYRSGQDDLLYTNSENILQWIHDQLGDTDISRQISLLKDKYQFREALQKLYPDYYYRKFTFNELMESDGSDLRFPFILKPVIGFFSYGIYNVRSAKDLEHTKKNLQEDLKRIRDIYPREVMNDAAFMAEEIIEGDEYAVDAYYDAHGGPVIMNIYKHLFASETDVSDRAYFTSPTVMREIMEPVEGLLRRIGQETKLRKFPLHIELRNSARHGLIPIEANAMRFAGWCMTDVTYHAWGMNPYTYYFRQQKPNWPRLLKEREGRQYNIYIADVPPNVDFQKIKDVDYPSIRNKFNNLLELRATDFNRYPVLAFIFTESADGDFTENQEMLREDFAKYLQF